MKHSPDVVWVVGDVYFLFDERGNSLKCPQVGLVSGFPGTRQEGGLHLVDFRLREAGNAPKNAPLAMESFHLLLFPDLVPVVDGCS